MKKTFFAIFAAAIGAASATPAEKGGSGSKPLKVLMIGNSFSVCVLREMPKVAADMGLGLDLCSMYIGGCTLERHARNIAAADKNPYAITWNYTSVKKGEEPFRPALMTKDGKVSNRSNISKMLAADKWDVVTVQQGSHASWNIDTYEPHGTKIVNEIRRLAPQARIYVQQTWSYTPWDRRLAKWKIDQNEMFVKLEDAYAKFAASHSLPMICMGKAVQRYREEVPGVYTEKTNDDVCGTSRFVKDKTTGKWRPSGDVFHLNRKGEFLQALVWTACLFDVDVTKSGYVPKCLAKQPERAALMRRIASESRKRK